MTDRDKLIELIKQATILHLDYLESIDQKGLTDTEGKARFIADHLLANGVIVPPCHIGQRVYQLYKKYNGDVIIRQGRVSAIQQKADKSWKIRITINSYVFEITPDKIGKTIFLTKEEAENA